MGPCCILTDEDEDFGTVAESTSFADVWNNRNFTAAREFFLNQKQSGTICDTCSKPNMQNQFFISPLKAILRNAPEWVLGLLAQNIDAFFCEADDVFLFEELDALRNTNDSFCADYSDVMSRMTEIKNRDVLRSEMASFMEVCLAKVHSPLAVS